jgi:hypothetical protein
MVLQLSGATQSLKSCGAEGVANGRIPSGCAPVASWVWAFVGAVANTDREFGGTTKLGGAGVNDSASLLKGAGMVDRARKLVGTVLVGGAGVLKSTLATRSLSKLSLLPGSFSFKFCSSLGCTLLLKRKVLTIS